MTHEIRPVRPEEAQELEDFLAFNAGEEFRPMAKDYIKCMFSHDYRRPTFLIAIEDDVIIGSIAYTEELFTILTWGISWVNVHPDKRNQGLGQALMERCLEEISKKAEKEVTIILATIPGKSVLYERVGFEKGWKDHEGGWFMMKTQKGSP